MVLYSAYEHEIYPPLYIYVSIPSWQVMSFSGILNFMKEKHNTKTVFIEWLDSKGMIREWEYIDELESLKPGRCISIGYLIEDNKEYKTIVQTLSDTQLSGRMTIPTGAILRMKEIKGVPRNTPLKKKVTSSS